jgi:hypothetical protein
MKRLNLSRESRHHPPLARHPLSANKRGHEGRETLRDCSSSRVE